MVYWPYSCRTTVSQLNLLQCEYIPEWVVLIQVFEPVMTAVSILLPSLTRKMKPTHLPYLLLTCFLLHEAACKPLKPNCDLVKCKTCPKQHIAVAFKNKCCATCVPTCSCPDHQEFECNMQGFKYGKIPLGESYYIDFATTKCTCVSPGNISCTSLCPTVSPTCKETGGVADGCPQCICHIEDYSFVVAGSTIQRDAEICKCPPEGGKLQCTPSKSHIASTPSANTE